MGSFPEKQNDPVMSSTTVLDSGFYAVDSLSMKIGFRITIIRGIRNPGSGFPYTCMRRKLSLVQY